MTGEEYRLGRARAAWALQVLGTILEPESMGSLDWQPLGELAASDPVGFVAAASRMDRGTAEHDPPRALTDAMAIDAYPAVIAWSRDEASRITLVPAGHWVVVTDQAPFRVTLRGEEKVARHAQSVRMQEAQVALIAPGVECGDAELVMERFAGGEPLVRARFRFLPLGRRLEERGVGKIVLLTNGAGAMARIGLDPGRVRSKYDCVLGANLHPTVPVDRHVLVKRARIWAMANGFLTALDGDNLAGFEPGPPARWRFEANAGDGRLLQVEMLAQMADGENTTLLRFERPGMGRDLDDLGMRLTVRLDIEDRNFHWETRRTPEADEHFGRHTETLAVTGRTGFRFAPAVDRRLRVYTDSGEYHPQAEWCEGIPHPVEVGRGQVGAGDAYSPGWFDLPLQVGRPVTLVITAEREGQERVELDWAMRERRLAAGRADPFERRLVRALEDFVVRRGAGKTVIAGYPWFLDWGRDTLICGRGLLAAGLTKEVEELLSVFGRWEQGGTLPNSIHGEDASNRNTSDASLWYGLLCEELEAVRGAGSLDEIRVSGGGRTLRDVLGSIGRNHVRGMANRIVMDDASGLLWSPAHFTWMDTNHPACTPREGYPIEIQALWIRLLRFLHRLGVPPEGEPWGDLARRAEVSVERHFWLEKDGWTADVLVGGRGTQAAKATPDDALRSNGLLAVGLGVLRGARARSCVEAARRHLVVPGAVRSLAPLPVRLPLEVRGADGRLLTDPRRPYRGRYEGEEDISRKPAYHNGTAWVWKLPVFCEALVLAWDGAREAVEAAKGYLSSVEDLLEAGCVGQLPEVLDGDAPHRQRGCDAQAWSVTETLRVWRWLREGAGWRPVPPGR
jgi:starch synthase (maltosyl-transferring)